MSFDSFLLYISTEKRYSAHTTEAYRADLEQFAAYVSQTYEITEASGITRQIVRSWISDLMDEGYQASSVHRKLSSINAWFRFLQKQGQLTANPAKGIPKPKLPVRLPVFLDERGAGMLYREMEESATSGFSASRDRLILQLLYETGMRVSELINLRDRDIDASIGQVRVTGKRNKTRYIPVSALMLSKMTDYRRGRDDQFTDKDDTFFVTDKGKKTTRGYVYIRVKHYLSGVTTQKKKSPHVLRHTFATHMLNNGAELNVIKEILGHSSLAATQVYTHLSVEKLKGIHGQAHPRSKKV